MRVEGDRLAISSRSVGIGNRPPTKKLLPTSRPWRPRRGMPVSLGTAGRSYQPFSRTYRCLPKERTCLVPASLRLVSLGSPDPSQSLASPQAFELSVKLPANLTPRPELGDAGAEPSLVFAQPGLQRHERGYQEIPQNARTMTFSYYPIGGVTRASSRAWFCVQEYNGARGGVSNEATIRLSRASRHRLLLLLTCPAG